MTGEQPGAASYRSIFSDLRDHARAYIRKQLLLPRQEIAEILDANRRAAMWFGIGAAVGLLFLVSLVAVLVGLIALLYVAFPIASPALTAVVVLAAFIVILRLPLSLLPKLILILVELVGALLIALLSLLLPASAVAAIGAAAATIMLMFLTGTIAFVTRGVKTMHVRGPERTIRSFKETVSWLKATLLGRSAS
jgi:hypothetical protein